jgi:4-diphosphocytidyl-2-C-methyl-D-erythritol kinase
MPRSMAIEAFVPAKINLALHVTGQRADGYHLLDSLVVFADIGDRVSARPGKGLHLTVIGPHAGGVPAGTDNLVLKAAKLLAERAGPTPPGAHLTLKKHLPAASGLGGGSGDAAAALRVLAKLWQLALPAEKALLSLGADLPVCLACRPARMRGIGERLEAVPPLPPAWVVLANPGVETPTPAVFAALERRENPPLPAELPNWRDAAELAAWMRMTRNDLEAPARRLFPVIGRVLSELTAQPGCLTARMSGSGATCVGLFADPLAAAAAVRGLNAAKPHWWVEHGAVLREPPRES